MSEIHIKHNFVPPKLPTDAELRLQAMQEAFASLPKKEQEEIAHVRERLNFLRIKYAASADLAIVYCSILIAKEQGQ
jgi:hypothetical protein